MGRRPTPDAGERSTLKHVAARAGVSATTVSRVLAGNYPVATATRARVMRAVRELDYIVNAQARALVGGNTRTVAFILRDLLGPFYACIGQGVELQAAEAGRFCLVGTTHGDPQRELALVDLMRAQNAEAVVLVGGGYREPGYLERLVHLAHSLDKAGSRLVLCGRPSPGDDVPATVVEYANESGARAMTNYLLSLGHRRIAFVGTTTSGFVTTDERVRGFHAAHASFGLTADPESLVAGDYTRASGYEAARRLIKSGLDCTAIFAVTDMVAAGVLVALREEGIRVPEDVSVVGYDDIPLTTDLYPALTTVHVPHEELGRTAVRLALDRHEQPMNQHVVLGTHIVVRDSAAPLPAGS